VKIKRGLSAGRVQSVAVKLIIEKEREIQDFTPVESWKIFADIYHEKYTLHVSLAKVAGREPVLKTYEDIVSIASSYTLPLTEKNTDIDEKTSTKLISAPLHTDFTLIDIVVKQGKKNPSAPFITSSLQQEGSRRF
jgi:DNA topoisomerase I